MILVKRMTPMIMPLRAAAVLHRYFDITLDSRLDPIIAEHTDRLGRRQSTRTGNRARRYQDRGADLQSEERTRAASDRATLTSD